MACGILSRVVNPENRDKLRARVVAAAEAALARAGHVSAIDILSGIGWLDPKTLTRWRQGQLRHLEEGIQTNLSRISEAMKLFRAWALEKGIRPSETAYVARTARRETLRFSKSGDSNIERFYRTHWVLRDLSEKKQARIREKASRPPKLTVVKPLEDD
jgi:hypothetical protein